MAYDLHITRREDWTDRSGPAISEAEWRDLIAADPELELDSATQVVMSDGRYVFAVWKGRAGAMGHYAGEITASDPDRPLIVKMVQVAKKLGATVQGDDGEVYNENGKATEREAASAPPGSEGLLSKIQGWFRHRRIVKENQQAAPAFKVGQRVKNPWGVKGVVIRVDKKANGGLGSVVIRLDNGSEHHFAYVASGLEIVEDRQA